MTGLKSILFILTLTSAHIAYCENLAFVICKFQKEVRTLSVEHENSRCQTLYTKLGKEQVIGSGQNIASCHKFLGDVKTKLLDSGWKCREAKDANVSELEGPSTQ